MRPSSLAAVLGTVALASSAAAQPAAIAPTLPPFPPNIAVMGRGEERVTPDRARVMLGVHTQAPTAAAAASQNARLQRAVLDTLQKLGIPADQISTTDYNVFPEQQYDQPNRRTRIVGYNVQNTVVVELKRIDQVGPVLDATLAKGANTVSSLTFYYADVQGAERRALAKAVEAARAEAEVIANAAGGRLGELLEMSSIPAHEPPRPVMMMDMRAKAESGTPTPISEGTQLVVGNVAARWRFVAGR